METDREQTSGAGSPPPKRIGPITAIVLAAAVVLPMISFGMCRAALSPYSPDSSGSRALIAFGLGVVAGFVVLMFLLVDHHRRASALALGLNVVGVIANLAEFFTQFHYTRGRQLRGPEGQVLPARAGAPPPAGTRARAARAWRNNGDTEAASVAAFAMLGLDLVQLGAPPALLRAAHEDALDELRHADLCHGLARSLGDGEAGPAPMPGLSAVRSRACTLAGVAVESWIEGAYLETVSAALARTLGDGVEGDDVRATLAVIAADEARHARHAWEVVAWCLDAGGAAVAAALREARDRLPAPDPPVDEPGSDGALEPFGIPGRDRQRAIAARCLAETKARLTRLLDGDGRLAKRAAASATNDTPDPAPGT